MVFLGDACDNGSPQTTIKIPRGGVIGVLGLSGCGKTTLLSLVSLLDEPDKGRILFHPSAANGRQVDYSRIYQNSAQRAAKSRVAARRLKADPVGASTQEAVRQWLAVHRRAVDWILTFPFLVAFGAILLVFDPLQRVARLVGQRPQDGGAGGTMVYAMPFSTESASATNLENTHSVQITGMRMVEGAWYVQLVGATVNKENAYPKPGTAVYTLLSGQFDQIP